MDPVSHLLFARMVAAVRTERARDRTVVSATVLGGLAPDVDAALMAVGWDVYLRWHDAGTHALAGTLVVALLTAGVVRLWAAKASVASLVFAAWLGTLSHVFMDLFSGGTVRLLWPLSSRMFTTPVVAMADLLVMAVLLVGAGALWMWPRRPRVAAAMVMAGLAVVCAGKLTTRTWAAAAHAQRLQTLGLAAEQTAVEAVWGSWRHWLFFDRLRDGHIRAWAVDGWLGDVRARFEQAPTRDAPFARASLTQFDTARNFSMAHAYAFATYRDTDAGAVVFWSDARFCWAAAEQADPQEGAPHQEVRPATGPVRCAMWFGGSLAPGGTPHEALVWLGGHLQRRTAR